jgi:signal transduction histidine kinase
MIYGGLRHFNRLTAMDQWTLWLERQSRGILAAASLFAVLVLGLIDYATGTQITLSVLYLFPIATAAWYVGARFAYGLAVLSVVLWIGGDMLAGQIYPSDWIPYWNGCIRLAFYVVFVPILVSLKSLQTDLEARVAQRTAALTAEMGERKRLEHELLGASDREQRRIGYDLHDSLGQHLTGTALASQVLADKLGIRNVPEAPDATKLVELIEEGISLSRRLAKGLNPVELSSDGLMQALDEFAAATRDLFGVSCRFECESPVLVADAVAATHLYRIAQEAVGNAIKHSGATRIVITLETQEDRSVLRIEDDGAGLPDPIPCGDGMGLRIMSNRAKMIGGAFEIARRSPAGTVVTCLLPPALCEQKVIYS